jgi:hypothetical protein
MEDAAAGTSLEMYLKMADDEAGKAPEEDSGDSPASDSRDVGERYVPFSSVYGSSAREITAVLEAADRAVEAPAVTAGAPAPPELVLAAKKSNTTRCVAAWLLP